MIVHEAVGMAKPVAAFIDMGKDLEKCFPVVIVFEYGLFIVASVGDVIHCAGVFYAEGACHGRSLADL